MVSPLEFSWTSEMKNLSVYDKWVMKQIESCTVDDMRTHLSKCRSHEDYKIGTMINAKCRNKDTVYTLVAQPAQNVEEVHTRYIHNGKQYEFRPHLHPRDMLGMGVFEGKMINDCMNEFPKEWYEKAIAAKKLSPNVTNVSCNKYKIRARSSLKDWNDSNWIYGDQDTRGWFQWYCRYCMGRRDSDIDIQQMERWRSFGSRFKGMLKRYPDSKKIKQNLLQWSHKQSVQK